MFYQTRSDMNSQNKYPRCISGVSANHNPNLFKKINGKMVHVYGKLFIYSELPSENYLIGRKLLSGSVVPNFCLGKFVLLVSNVSIAP